MRARPLSVTGAALLAVAVAGCGGSSSKRAANSPGPANPNAPEVSPAGDIPDNQAYVAYHPPGSFYSVRVPEGWARTAAGGAVSFTDKLNAIRMEAGATKAAPTTAGATSTEVRKLTKSVPGFKLGQISTVSRTAGRALLITYAARSPADPVTGRSRTDAVERYIFFHDGQAVTLTLTGPKGADNVDPWKIVTDSLRYTR